MTARADDRSFGRRTSMNVPHEWVGRDVVGELHKKMPIRPAVTFMSATALVGAICYGLVERIEA